MDSNEKPLRVVPAKNPRTVTNTKQYRSGYHAGLLQGITLKSNPYAKGSQKYYNWNSGVRNGRKERERAIKNLNNQVAQELEGELPMWD